MHKYLIKKIQKWIYTGYFILDGKTADLWIKAIENHGQLYPECSGKLMWDESSELQRGLAWHEQSKCNTCSFVSKLYNLYTEVISNKRGPNTAAINLRSQVGMKHMGLRKTHMAIFIL